MVPARHRFVACALLVLSGCVPLVLPPTRVTIGPAASAGIEGVPPKVHDRRQPNVPADLLGAEVRVSVEPLAMLGADFHDRRFDVGAGYVYLNTGTHAQRFAYHGGFVETGVHLLAFERRARAHRLSLHAAGEVLARRFDGLSGAVYGGRLSLDYETGLVADRYTAAGHHEGFVGYMRGETTIGASLGLAVRTFRGDPAFTATLSLSFRLPGIAGAIGVFPR